MCTGTDNELEIMGGGFTRHLIGPGGDVDEEITRPRLPAFPDCLAPRVCEIMHSNDVTREAVIEMVVG